jgi:hypothetical protein
MSNRILQLQVREHSLDPAQAELWIAVSAEHVTPATELRGRLAGPRCLYAATVEIGYPLRPFSRRPYGLEGLAARVIIPEPSLWEPQCPFVYQGTVELWQDGARCDQVLIRRGLRQVTLGRGGLRVNGRPLALRGRSVDGCDEKQIAALRRANYNLLLATTMECLSELAPLADVYGFLVLGALKETEQAASDLARALADHPSFLGWFLKAPWTRRDADAIARLRGGSGALVGVELAERTAGAPPEGVGFIVCGAGVAAELGGPGETRPLLLLGDGPDSPAAFGRVE